jgi:NADPH:quinone reductase-like Zn-dependent oxidoreductase
MRPVSNAELELVDSRIASVKPTKLSFASAAALPLCAITAWESMMEHMHIPLSSTTQKKSILIVNGAGGVGSIAIQLAKQLLNLEHVIATASRPESVAWCQKMGATAVINHKEPLTPQLEKLGVKQLDYVLLAFDPDLFMDELAGLIAPMGHINAILPIMKLSPAASGGLFWKAANISYTLMYTKAMFNVGRLMPVCRQKCPELTSVLLPHRSNPQSNRKATSSPPAPKPSTKASSSLPRPRK